MYTSSPVAHHMRPAAYMPHPVQTQQFHGPPYGSPIRYHGFDQGHMMPQQLIHHHRPPADGSPSPSQARFMHHGRETRDYKQASDQEDDDQWRDHQWRDETQRDGVDKSERALLRKISILKQENRILTEKLDITKGDNARLEEYGADLRKKLESTRSALKDSRDSLEKVQSAIKPLMQNQRTRDEQHQQLMHLNRMYETKLRECEERLRMAELMNTQRQVQLEKEAGGVSEDTLLIEKLHERLLASQNQLIKVQSELQRNQIEKASMASELAENQRKISSFEVQLLMASQAHAQTEAAKKEEYKAKENSWRVQLESANRQVAVLEERLALEAHIREQDRREDEQMRENNLNVDVAAAMRRINNIEQQQTLEQKAQNLRMNATYALPPDPATAQGPSKGNAVSPGADGGGSDILVEHVDQISAGDGYINESEGAAGRMNEGADGDGDGGKPFEEEEEDEDDFPDIRHSMHAITSIEDSTIDTDSGTPLPDSSNGQIEESVAGENGISGLETRGDEFDIPIKGPTDAQGDAGEGDSKRKKKKGFSVSIIDPANITSDEHVPDEEETEDNSDVNKPILFRPESVVSEELSESKTEKEALRLEIKAWINKFIEEHKRDPTSSEKKQGLGKHTFVRYHKLQERAESLTKELEQVKAHLAGLGA